MANNRVNDSSANQESSGLASAWKTFKLILKILFPAYVLIQMNRQLAKAKRFYKNSWFDSQIKRNFLASILLSSLFIAPVTLGFLAIKGNEDFSRNIQRAKRSLYSKEISRASSDLVNAFSGRAVDYAKIFGLMAILGMISSNVIVYYYHDLVRDSKKLVKLLKHEGIIDREAANPVALFTPVGILIDISGSAPKEIALNERIWLAMNIQIKDWAEDPDKRSLVFFKTAFKLKPRYDYTI